MAPSTSAPPGSLGCPENSGMESQALRQAFYRRVCRTLCPEQMVAGGQPRPEQGGRARPLRVGTRAWPLDGELIQASSAAQGRKQRGSPWLRGGRGGGKWEAGMGPVLLRGCHSAFEIREHPTTRCALLCRTAACPAPPHPPTLSPAPASASWSETSESHLLQHTKPLIAIRIKQLSLSFLMCEALC